MGVYKAYASDDAGRQRISVEPRKEGSSLVLVTPNLCDPTTWWYNSKRIEDEVLTDSGDGLTFTSSKSNWIDLVHGKLYREDLVSAGLLPIVKVDDAVKAERAPFADSGGDYVIDYEAGTVTFASSQSGNVVKASFNYEDGSLYVIAPSAGKRLWVEESEVQFSADIVLTDTVHFQAWAYAPPELGYPPGTKVPVGAATTYKTARDFVDEARGTYPQIPAFGGSKRGTTNQHLVFPFKYLQLKELLSTYGVEIRVWLDSDLPFGGEFATATFYCSSYDL